MNLKHLNYFYQLSIHQHYGKAAKACFITQPTLSACIHSLEKELGVGLVVRDKHFIGLTEEGYLLAKFAEQTLTAQASFSQALSLYRGELSGLLRIAVVPQSSTEIIEHITNFKSRYKNVKIRLNVMQNSSVIQQLKAHQIDLAVAFRQSFSEENLAEFNVHSIGATEIALLVAKDKKHDFAENSKWTLVDLKKTPLALLSPEMQFRQTLDKQFESFGIYPKVEFETDSLFHLVSAVTKMKLAAIVSLNTAKVLAQDHPLIYYKLDCQSLGETAIFHRKKHVSPVIDKFIQTLL
ncbi:LysR family transcriptional regulator [Gayadomonas joobiniege]|uniref:LysR family transcriptional regulator n=1 Tax=Gayadomonas joobiniege TaxID=1234606 RepID=UPI00037A0E4C|nr:LysR family transcriptional regulator [Gayadomonas joobiniege]